LKLFNTQNQRFAWDGEKMLKAPKRDLTEKLKRLGVGKRLALPLARAASARTVAWRLTRLTGKKYKFVSRIVADKLVIWRVAQ
jgi:hypothetical protein